MNECFFVGKIINEIDFNFIYKSKYHISVARFDLLLANNENVSVKAYDDLADLVYSKFDKGDIVLVYGYLNQNYNVIVKELNHM